MDNQAIFTAIYISIYLLGLWCMDNLAIFTAIYLSIYLSIYIYIYIYLTRCIMDNQAMFTAQQMQYNKIYVYENL